MTPRDDDRATLELMMKSMWAAFVKATEEDDDTMAAAAAAEAYAKLALALKELDGD